MKKLFSLLTLALLTLSVGAANTYVKVTSADQLEAGKKYILVNEAANAAMGTIGTYGAAITVTVGDGVVDIDGTAVIELTLGGATGAWTFDTGSGNYLNYTGTKNTLTTGTDATVTSAQWTATEKDGGYILTNVATTERILQYNNNSGQERFACYKGTQQDAVLYVQDAAVTPPVTVAAPSLPAAQEFTETLTVTITDNEGGADLYYSYDGETWTAYTEPLVLTATTTVYAKAEKNGVTSAVVHQTYTKVEPVPEPLGNTYALVTNVSELANGDQIIFVNSGVAGDAKAMGNQNGNGNNFLSTDVIIGEDLKVTSDAVQVLCLEANGDNWYLKTLAGKYLYAASSSSNYLKLENAPDDNDNAVASIAIADSAIVVFQGTNTHNIVRYNYNNGNPLFSCYEEGKMAPIYIFKSTGQSSVVAPTLPASQEFTESLTVEITAEDGATIMYSFDGETWNTYTEPLVITETTTVYAKAVKGNTESTVVSATYTLKTGPATVANIAEGNALTDGTEFTFTGEAVVCFKHNKNMWIRDNSGSVQVYGSANFGDEFAKGVVITPNWGAKKATYNGMHEYTDLTNFTASNQTQTVEPFVRETLTMDNANEYVVLQNVTIDSTYTSGNKPNYVTNTGVICRNNYGINFTPQDGVAYNIIGIVSAYNNVPQLYITEVEGYVAPVATPNDLAEANALTDNMQFTYQNDVAATYQNGNYLFIRDENGNSGLIFGAVEATFETGDVLGSDWGATKTTYYGVPEYTNPTGVTNSGNTWTVEPYERETLTTANVNEYVIMKGLSLVACADTTVSHYDQTYYNVADSMIVYNQFGVDMSALDESKTYDVVGIATIYKNKAQLYIISITEVQDDVMRGDLNGDGQVNTGDLSALIAALLNNATESLVVAADPSQDGQINTGDISALISYLLNGTW